MATAPVVEPEQLISVDSHVWYTDEWVTERLPQNLRQRWIDGRELYQQRELEMRGGFIPDINDIMDPVAWNDPGHYEAHAKLKAMDRDGVYAEVIFPEVGGAKMCSPSIMGDVWQQMLSGFNDAIADFAAIDPKRLMCAYQLLPHDIPASVKEVERVARATRWCTVCASASPAVRITRWATTLRGDISPQNPTST